MPSCFAAQLKVMDAWSSRILTNHTLRSLVFFASPDFRNLYDRAFVVGRRSGYNYWGQLIGSQGYEASVICSENVNVGGKQQLLTDVIVPTENFKMMT